MPLDDPFGFGASDYLEITVAVLLVGLTFLWPLVAQKLTRFAERTAWCMAALAILPVVLRLLLLPDHPVPSPEIYDEFGHLLVAGTLGHLRFANPMHPMHRFFETFFVLQEPTYSSIYPLGQGVMLAAGRLLFGLPWAGVVLATGALCALIYWMLRAWVSAEWALAGGLLAVMEFGPLSGWMNSYWGGALVACAGCLVFGALPRVIERGRWRDGVLLGLGLAIHLLTRPYESILLLAGATLFFVFKRSFRMRPLVVAAAFLAGAGGVMLLQNRSVTGNWLVTPYQLSQFQYGVPVGLTLQTDPVPHRELTAQQRLEYESQLAFRNSKRETWASYLERLEYRVRYYRFFFAVPLYVALIAWLFAFRSAHWWWVLSTVAIFALGSNLFPSFEAHYIAATTCLFLLMSVEGLRRLGERRWGRPVVKLILFFCAAQFVFWYTLHLTESSGNMRGMERYEPWDSINHRTRTPRFIVNQQIAGMPGQLLVFVHYAPQHIFQQEWVNNEADIDASRVVWARDLGPAEDAQLIRYYPQRTPLLLDADAQPPKLTPYQPEPVTETQSAPAPAPASKKPSQPALRFQDVK